MNCYCGFSAKSHNEGEMVEVGGVHGKRSHPGMKLSPADVKKMVKMA